MEYILMHKNIPVAEITLDTHTSGINSIGKIYTVDHTPVGVPVKDGKINRKELNNWWISRAIPASRDGIEEVLRKLDMAATPSLLEKCLGLSLSDHYWIRPKKTELQWKDVNFFENEFSGDMGDILLGGSVKKNIDFLSPDNTSDGWLKKRWKILGGKRCLIKGGSGAVQQESYNEVFAGKLCQRAGIPHVSYSLLTYGGYPFCACENFLDEETEFVSAWRIIQTQKQKTNVSVYRHFLNCCEHLGIPGMEQSLDMMLTLDYLIVNQDRHLNNFGAVRNSETLEWVGPAPLFDSGSSLWYLEPPTFIHTWSIKDSKPFLSTHDGQIQLVTLFGWLDTTSLDNAEEDFREVVSGSVFVDAVRTEAICKAFCARREALKDIVKRSHPMESNQKRDGR